MGNPHRDDALFELATGSLSLTPDGPTFLLVEGRPIACVEAAAATLTVTANPGVQVCRFKNLRKMLSAGSLALVRAWLQNLKHPRWRLWLRKLDESSPGQ